MLGSTIYLCLQDAYGLHTLTVDLERRDCAQVPDGVAGPEVFTADGETPGTCSDDKILSYSACCPDGNGDNCPGPYTWTLSTEHTATSIHDETCAEDVEVQLSSPN